MQANNSDSNTTIRGINVRLARREDLPRVLEISNWAIEHTAANFTTEPETLEHWASLWDDTHRKYPWFVSESDGKLVGFAMASPYKGR